VYSLKPFAHKGRKIIMHRNNLKRHIQRDSKANDKTEIEPPKEKNTTPRVLPTKKGPV
jgi:hypothetical protein